MFQGNKMTSRATREVTDLLIAWREGDETALAELMPIVYRRLKRMAVGYLRGERREHTLDPTALVHEAYLRLVQLKRVSWQDRAHFYAICAQMMRRVLVEHARQRDSAKRGRGFQKVPIETLRDLPPSPSSTSEARRLVALDEALSELAAREAVQAQVVELRYFGGLNRDEIAEVLGISSATVTRKWRQARAWLLRYLSHSQD